MKKYLTGGGTKRLSGMELPNIYCKYMRMTKYGDSVKEEEQTKSSADVAI